jgi:S1-C subfamily serine protease
MCGRSVPARITTCYCGRERREEPAAPASAPHHRLSIRSLGIGAGAVALALAAWYSGTKKPPGRPAVRTAAPAIVTSRTVIGASNTNPDAMKPPSADMIQLALQSIVLVETSDARGTGFFTGADLVTTSRHVLGTQSGGTITTADGRRLEATIAAVADEQDLAVLRVMAPSPPARLTQAPARDVRPGQHVVRVSWPQGVTEGVIRGLRRDGHVELIEIDLPVHGDDEGAPVIDFTGRVLGLVTTRHTGSASSGFAVGFDNARAYLPPALLSRP